MQPPVETLSFFLRENPKANPKAKHGAAAADWRLVPVKSMLDEMMRFLQIGCDPNKGERKKSNLALST